MFFHNGHKLHNRMSTHTAAFPLVAYKHIWKYDVFLSFRGEGTRMSFTCHLHHALYQNGVYAFMDDKDLKKKETVSLAILKAIAESKFSITILSTNYASSKCCLDELVQILECKASKQQMVLPIFFGVDPTKVRNGKGSFVDALAQHEEKFGDNVTRVQKWRAALKETANLSGWQLGNGCVHALTFNLWCNLSLYVFII